MAFKFEELKIWQVSLSLSDEIDVITKLFPKAEQFSLTTQIKKAADSVNLNIACLFMARNRKYISSEQFGYFYNEYEQLCKMINALKNSLR